MNQQCNGYRHKRGAKIYSGAFMWKKLDSTLLDFIGQHCVIIVYLLIGLVSTKNSIALMSKVGKQALREERSQKLYGTLGKLGTNKTSSKKTVSISHKKNWHVQNSSTAQAQQHCLKIVVGRLLKSALCYNGTCLVSLFCIIWNCVGMLENFKVVLVVFLLIKIMAV